MNFKNLFNDKKKVYYLVASIISIWILVGIFSTDKNERKLEEYQELLQKREREVPGDLMRDRDLYLKEYYENPIRALLVDNKIVESKYLPLLTGIGRAWLSAGKDGFSVNQKIINHLKENNSQIEFLGACGKLVCRGGLPVEMVEVYLRYVEKFGLSGNSSDNFYDIDGNKIDLPISFDLATPMVIIDPNDTKALKEIIKLSNSGIFNFQDVNLEGKYFPFLLDEERFQAHIVSVFPKNEISVDIKKFQAAKIHSDYHSNEVSADRKYKGKLVQVSGRVSDIRKDFMDDIIIELATENQFMGMSCYVNDEDVAASLSNGQSVLLECRCEGMVMGSVVMKDCKLLRSK